MHEKTNSAVKAGGEDKYLSIDIALEGLESGPFTVSIHENADCGNPGEELNLLPIVKELVNGKIEYVIRVDGVNIRSFLNRSIVITKRSAEDKRSVMCGTSI